MNPPKKRDGEKDKNKQYRKRKQAKERSHPEPQEFTISRFLFITLMERGTCPWVCFFPPLLLLYFPAAAHNDVKPLPTIEASFAPPSPHFIQYNALNPSFTPQKYYQRSTSSIAYFIFHFLHLVRSCFPSPFRPSTLSWRSSFPLSAFLPSSHLVHSFLVHPIYLMFCPPFLSCQRIPSSPPLNYLFFVFSFPSCSSLFFFTLLHIPLFYALLSFLQQVISPTFSLSIFFFFPLAVPLPSFFLCDSFHFTV